MSQENQPADEAAAAFAALRAEVEALRQAVEALPDTAPTLAVVARALTAMQKHPALQLTPQAHADQLRAAQEAAQREGERALDHAARRVSAAAGELARIVEQARTAERQNWRLLQVGGAAAIGGAVLWATLSGPVARSFPAGWHVPEKMAAAAMGEDRVTAGQHMIASQDPRGWAETMITTQLLRANRERIADCRWKAVEAKRAQTCVIRVAPFKTDNQSDGARTAP